MIIDKANRVIFNTVVLYLKIIVTTLIALVSVPLIMHALGESDYGLYALVGGVVALLAFLKASMTVSTQRYLSVALGENDTHRYNVIFNSSFVLHVLMALLIALVLEVCTPLLFNGFLNIEPDRISAARIIYQFLIITTITEVVSVPFTGVINAKEDMLLFSILGIFEALGKLGIALYLAHCHGDRLIVYGLGMMIISLIVLMTNIIFVMVRYHDVQVRPKTYFNKQTFKEIIGFTGWNTVGALAVVGQSQSIAVIINLFCGTVINAAYGVANQINGVMGYFSNTFRKAINPQLMQSFGMHDRERLVRLAYITSKFSVLVMSTFALPLIIEMDFVLQVWLGEVPEYTLQFSRLILIYAIINQYSAGLMAGMQASGRIMSFILVTSALLLMSIPVCYGLLAMDMPPYYCIYAFIVIEIITLIVRMGFAKRVIGTSNGDFIRLIIWPTFVCILCSTLAAGGLHLWLTAGYVRLCLVGMLFLVVYMLLTWLIALNESERQIFIKLFHKLCQKKSS